MAKERTYLLEDADHRALTMALEVLCGVYAGGVESPDVKRLLKEYGPGTQAGRHAIALVRHLDKLRRIRIDQIRPKTPAEKLEYAREAAAALSQGDFSTKDLFDLTLLLPDD